MAKIESFEELDIWKEAVKIAVRIYKMTAEGKMEKDFRAKDQLRAAAISISNNIAEGFEHNSRDIFKELHDDVKRLYENKKNL